MTVTGQTICSETRSRDAAVQYRPYVVSLDIHGLLADWTRSVGFAMPADSVFEQLRANMQARLAGIFESVEVVGEYEIRPHLLRLVRETDLPIITLDQVYCTSGASLRVTRAVHADKSDAGLTHRFGTRPIENQIDSIAAVIQGNAVLVDDVIFSGNMIANGIIPLLRDRGINIRAVCAGIGIGEGIDRIESVGPVVHCVKHYESVVDEICERDFYPGIPLCGRTLLGAGDIGMAYVLPFGDPCSWASIPQDTVVPFSCFCLEQTIRLFMEIEQASGKQVRVRDLPRGVHFASSGSDRFAEVLIRAREALS